MEKKKIFWLTPDYFLDCDIDIIPKLISEFDIHWVVVLPAKNARYQAADVEKLKKYNGLTIDIFYSKYRDRNPLYLFFYIKLLSNRFLKHADIVYINHVATPFFTIVALLMLNRKKTIFTAHQGAVHSGFNFQFVFKLMYKIAYSWFKFNNLFSISQNKLFKNNYPANTTHVIPLALKSFGTSNKNKVIDKVVFFTFGTIRPKKNIDILIDAACKVYEAGFKDFKIVLAGDCDNWSFYQDKIKYPEIFECIIRPIENAEIADLFAKYHYLVLPYSIVTQSGPLKIAFNYNVPVIASDLPGFADELKNGINGYLFKMGDVEDLKNVMIQALVSHQYNYSNLLHSEAEYIEENYADSVILKKYIQMFTNRLNS